MDVATCMWVHVSEAGCTNWNKTRVASSGAILCSTHSLFKSDLFGPTIIGHLNIYIYIYFSIVFNYDQVKLCSRKPCQSSLEVSELQYNPVL